MVICLERGADLHMAQLMPLPLTVSCSSKIQIGFYRAMLFIRGTSRRPVSVRVCPSQVGVLLKRLNESGSFLAWELRLPYPTPCCKEIHVPSKITVLPSGILLQTLDLENFATASRQYTGDIHNSSVVGLFTTDLRQ